MKAFRIAQAKHAQSIEDLLSGEGARRFGGRWNSPGVPAVYCSQSLSLAALEILVHLHSPRVLERYFYLEITLPDSDVEWLDNIAPFDMATVGDARLGIDGILGFCVQSVVMPPERNLVLNPLFPGFFDRISYNEILPLRIDDRLLNR